MISLELLQMRLLSFMLWHHLAYMVVSMVLLGLGAGGVWLSVRSTSILARADAWLVISTGLAGLTTVGAFAVMTRLPLDTFTLSGGQFLRLAIYYGVLLIPYFFAGLSLSILFTRGIDRIGRLYFIDLIGSAAGAYLFYLLILPLGAPRALAVMATGLALSGTLFAAGSGRKGLVALSLVFVLATAASIPFIDRLLQPQPAGTKALALMGQKRGARIVHSRWTPISRIDVLESDEISNPFTASHWSGDLVKAVTIDGDATTWIWKHDDVRVSLPPRPQVETALGSAEVLEKQLSQTDSQSALTSYHAAFLLKQAPKVLIIGPGGGNEIFVAHQMGASSVTGVELNPVMLEMSQSRYADFVGHIYQAPNAQAIVGEGRSYVRRTDQRYDILQMSGVDTWSGLSSGAYVLSENYLYTVEAFRDFLNHLEMDGILSVGRWRMDPARECLRLVSVAAQALREEGIVKPQEHIAFLSLSSPDFIRMLVKRTPFLPAELDTLRQVVQKVGGRLYAAPGAPLDNPYSQLVDAFATGTEAKFFADYPYDVTPVYDDQPFFFEYYKWSRFWNDLTDPGTGGQIGANKPVALTVLGALLAQTVALAALLMLIPLMLFKRRGLHVPRWGGVVGYFSLIGLAFMFVEISLMQQFVLFLGHPAYSIPVVLASLLVAAGCGSWISTKIGMSRRRLLALALTGVAIVLAASLSLFPLVFDLLLGQPLSLRIAATVGMLAIPGILMGMPFPLGLALASRTSTEIVPWAWAINGAASVLGSILVIFVAMGLGFSASLLAAAGLYLMALLLTGSLTAGQPGD